MSPFFFVFDRRRRRNSDMNPDEKREKFLERNRAAATRCRNKRKMWVSSLEKKADELNSTNTILMVRWRGRAFDCQQALVCSRSQYHKRPLSH